VNLHNDLREFIELLNASAIDFLVVGGHAVAFHGFPRFTGDIDFLLRASKDNAVRLKAVLTSFGFDDSLDEYDMLRPGDILQLGKPPNRIDILTSISGVSFDDAWSNRDAGVLGDIAVSFIGREELIKNKRAAGRQKDLADLEELLARDSDD